MVLDVLRSDTGHSPAPELGRPLSAPFFDCMFVGCPNEMAGNESYAIYRDEQSHGFAETLIRTCRGDKNFRGAFRDPAQIPPDVLVFVEGPVWDRTFETLRESGVSGPRVRVLLYFDFDPSGFWDFAIACGADLSRIFREGVDTATLETLQPFLELYTGGRTYKGRILSYAKFYTRDFLPLQIENGSKIARVMAAMADDKSRADYARILFGTNEQVFQAFTRAVFGPQQYMDIVRLKPGDTVINCGVGRGWEIPYFLSRMQGEGRLHNIDPNTQYRSSPYAAFIDRFSHVITDHLIIAGDRDGRIQLGVKDASMIISDTSQSAAAFEGDFVEFDCRSIDSLMHEGVFDRLDYLKMDVEGGEMTILKGAIETIRKFRPKLAIAIYHEPHHFWDYPSFVLDNFEDYTLYLRQYGYSRFETLLYAIPKESIADRSGDEGIRHVTAPEPLVRTGKHNLLYYMRDGSEHPREIYNGRRRSLARVMGSDWATAEISPAPWVDAEPIGIVEEEDETLLFTFHRENEDIAHLIIGVSKGPTDIEWVASQGTPANGACIVVQPAGDEIQLILHEGDNHSAALVSFDSKNRQNRSLRSLKSFLLPGWPVCASWQDSNLVVVCRNTDGGYVRAIVEEVDRAQGIPLELPPGRFAGIVSVRAYGGHGAEDEPGFGMIDDASKKLVVYRDAGESFERVGEMDFDPRAKLVTTYVRPKRPR